MEGLVPQQRRGWLSWFGRAVWGVSQPEQGGGTNRTGTFFPFLRGTSSNDHDQRQQVAAAPGSSSSSSISSRVRVTTNSPGNGEGKSGGDDDGETRSRASSLPGRAAEMEELKRDLPSVWEYLREEEGWSFVNTHSWDVQGPAADAAGAAPPVASERSEFMQHESGPMPQGQVGCRVPSDKTRSDQLFTAAASLFTAALKSEVLLDSKYEDSNSSSSGIRVSVAEKVSVPVSCPPAVVADAIVRALCLYPERSYGTYCMEDYSSSAPIP